MPIQSLLENLPWCVGASLVELEAGGAQVSWAEGEPLTPGLLDRLQSALGGWPTEPFEYVVASQVTHVVVGRAARLVVLAFLKLENHGLALALAKAALGSSDARAH